MLFTGKNTAEIKKNKFKTLNQQDGKIGNILQNSSSLILTS